MAARKVKMIQVVYIMFLLDSAILGLTIVELLGDWVELGSL